MTRKGRIPRRNDQCGHTDVRHWAKGMCKACYFWKRLHPEAVIDPARPRLVIRRNRPKAGADVT